MFIIQIEMARSPVPDFFLKFKNPEVFNADGAHEEAFKYFDTGK